MYNEKCFFLDNYIIKPLIETEKDIKFVVRSRFQYVQIYELQELGYLRVHNYLGKLLNSVLLLDSYYAILDEYYFFIKNKYEGVVNYDTGKRGHYEDCLTDAEFDRRDDLKRRKKRNEFKKKQKLRRRIRMEKRRLEKLHRYYDMRYGPFKSYNFPNFDQI